MFFNGINYEIQGINPSDLCKKYDTPLYVYDAAIIERQYKKLVAAYQAAPRLRINYAMKALSNLSVLSFLRRLGACVDTVSIEEVKLALKAGFSAHQIGYTPSGVRWSEIEEAVALGVHIHLDSIPLMKKFGEHYGNAIGVGLRINPHVKAGGNFKISTAHDRSKFGISIHQLEEVIKTMQQTGIKIDGLHQHTGSEIKDASTFLEVAEIIFDAAKNFPDLESIDLGGGFKVPYKPDDKEADIIHIGAEITKRFNDFCATYGRDLTLILEPGKFLVAQCGYLLAQVNIVKHSPSLSFAGIDTGLNHLIRPMMYDAYHEIINISKNPNSEKNMYNVVGYICETDTFGENRLLNTVKEGDILAICNAGAYSYSMSSNYNARFRPAEVLVYNGVDYLIKERENFEDLVRGQKILEFL